MLNLGKNEIERSPERLLVIAMFERAILDYFFNSTSEKNYKDVNRKDAEKWLIDDYECSASFWADLADMEDLLQTIRKLIEEQKKDVNFYNGLENGNRRNPNKHEIQRPVRRRKQNIP